ncbi:MAG: proteasome subunit alpha [Candidatus Helarchaeota archaeon]|nr:proteasome subunit alpha [Candidatus Helarchaeota archaeon]
MMDPRGMGGYDRIATMFSPDGRIHQIEYAREAVKRGSLVLAARNSKGLVILSELKHSNPLFEFNEKIFQIDEYIYAAYSGLLADSRVLIDQARVEAQIQRIYYNEEPNLDVLSWKISNIFQKVTQYGGRPFGVSLLFAGFDHNGPSLHLIEPSGAKFTVNAIAVGRKEDDAVDLLKTQYNPKATLSEMKEMLLNIYEQVIGEKKPAELLLIDQEKKEIKKERVNL